MDSLLRILESVFLWSSSASNFIRIFQADSIFGCLYLVFITTYLLGWLRLRPVRGAMMFASPLSIFNAFIFFTIQLSKISNAESSDVIAASYDSTDGAFAGKSTGSTPTKTVSPVATDNGAITSFRPIFTVPTEADIGAPILPNILDPEAIDAQIVCPGYVGSKFVRTNSGLTATLTLAGKACNVYGTDIEALNLTVEYQSADRLSVKIAPAILDASNVTQYNLPNSLLMQPTIDSDAGCASLENDLNFIWSNDPTFSFSIYRVSTGDVLFSTAGSRIVFENQFVEFASTLPENYNLYGLGESIHALRLGNNYTKTFWAADVGDVIDSSVEAAGGPSQPY